MNKTRIYAFLLALVFIGAALGVDSCNQQDQHLKTYARQIEAYLHPSESEIETRLREQTKLWDKIFHPEQLPEQERLLVLEDLEKLRNAPYSIYFFKKDSLVFWTKNTFVLDSLMSWRRGTTSAFMRLPNGVFEKFDSQFERDGDTIRTLVLLRIKHEFPLTSEYLSNNFPANQNIPYQIEITETKTAYPVRNKEGKTLFFLTANQPFKDSTQQKKVLLLYLLGIGCCGFLLNSIARSIVQKYRPWWGAAFLILAIIMLRTLSFQLGWTQKFDNLKVFAQTFSTPVLNYSLGDLLIDILLLLWLMVFFHREFQLKPFINVGRIWQYLLTTLNYFSIILGILMVTSVYKSLVLDSGIVFDFDNVFLLDIYSIMAILGVIVLLFALFLFSHRMMLTIQKTGLPRRLRMYSLFSAILLSFPVILLTDLNLPFWAIALTSSLFIMLFDLFIDSKASNIVWAGVWLFYFASFSAVLLFKYNYDKDIRIRQEFAQKLAEWQDDTAVEEFHELAEAIEHDPNFVQTLFNKEDTLTKENKVSALINNFFSNSAYLLNIYTYRFDVIESDAPPSDSLPKSETEKEREMEAERETERANLPSAANLEVKNFFYSGLPKEYYFQKLNESVNTKYADIHLWSKKGELFTYVAAIYVRNPFHPGAGKFVFMEIEKRLREPSMVYSELILTKQFKNLPHLDRFEYAVYQDGRLVEQTGKSYEINLGEFPVPERGNTLERKSPTRSDLVYRAPDDTVVIIGRDVMSLMKPISLFSYLFILLILSAFIMVVANTFLNILPETLQFNLNKKPSLKTKIQLGVIAVIITSFVLIGTVTVLYFQTTSEDYHENRLFRKLNSVLMDTEHLIQYAENTTHLDFPQLAKTVSTIHRMDVNIFDTDGNLITSSEMDIFNKNLIAPQMGSIAFHALARQGHTDVIQNEKIGDLEYKSAYVALRASDGSIIGYIGLPYYAKQRNLRDDVSEFMGTLLNVYVFLLLIASTVAIFIANSVTKPLTAIAEQFRRFKLGGKHEPLPWNSKDELGALIEDYNRMIKEVEESAEKLKKSEREGAWRTMAQQVAHEIKNPLTPMKLSIQHLLLVIKSHPERALPMVEKVARTMTEQIENLTEIATSFSNFAKMPKPENQVVALNSMVESVCHLFSESTAVQLTLKQPEHPIHVFVDKNQMMRVLNNLISNAIQAMPDERKPIIDVTIIENHERVSVKVSDNGKGISDDMKEKIFMPHFTTKTSGMGLGLAMCKDIVEMAGGRIYFETVVGHGTDFFVELPKTDQAPEVD